MSALPQAYVYRWRYRVSIALTLAAMREHAKGNTHSGVLFARVAKAIAPKRGPHDPR